MVARPGQDHVLRPHFARHNFSVTLATGERLHLNYEVRQRSLTSCLVRTLDNIIKIRPKLRYSTVACPKHAVHNNIMNLVALLEGIK